MTVDLLVEGAALVAFGVFAGALAGLLGVGGGIVIVPLLVLVAGLDQQSAQATSLAVILPTALVATWASHRRGLFETRTAVAIGLAGSVGGLAGAAVALATPGDALQVMFAALLSLVGLRLVRDGLRLRRAST